MAVGFDSVVTFRHPALSSMCAPVEVFDARLTALVARLERVLAAERFAVGVAASQLAVLRRVFVWGLPSGESGVCVNPTVVASSDVLVSADEGCLSLPGVLLPVARPAEVDVEFADLDGVTRRRCVGGFQARLFQHEIDHLNGVLALDRTTAAARSAALRRLV